MQAIVEDLIQILIRQNVLYEQVLELLEEEHSTLVSSKPQSVLELVRRKETTLLKIRTLDESRQLISLRLSRRMGIPQAELNLTALAELLESEQANRLRDVQTALQNCMGKLQILNQKTSQLCRQGIEVVHEVLQNVAREERQACQGDSYDRSGSNGYASPKNGNGHLHYRA
ncbi:MAG: flagellar export chaperone FlgN [Candidatus Sumerlaeia bacterium]